MTRGTRGRANVSGVRGREVVDGPRSREVLEGGRSRQVLLGPRGRNTGGLPAALREATLFLDAKYSVAGEPRVINQGTGGSALDAKYGSVLGAYVYDGAAVLPGLTGNYLSTPDAAALDITGDIEVVFRASLDDWSSGAIQRFVSKYTAAGNQRSYLLRVTATGNLAFFWSTTGADFPVATSTVPVPFADGETGWVKVTLDVDNGAGGSDVKFWTAADSPTEPSSWTQLGSTVTNAGVTSIFASSSVCFIGSTETGTETVGGSVYRTIVRDGIDGTTVLDVDLANVADYATSFTATTGQTVTVNSTSSDTNDPLLLTHTGENYVYFPGVAANWLRVPQSMTAVTGDVEIVGRITPTAWSSEASLITNTFNATDLRMAAGGALALVVHDVAERKATASSVPYSLGSTIWVKATFNSTAGTTTFYWAADQATEPSSWTTISTNANTGWVGPITIGYEVNIGARLGGGLPFTGRIHRAIFRNGIAGTALVDVDMATDITDAGATSFTASSGQTVTVNRATSGRKTALVTRPVWLFGTDDYLEVADNALLDFGDGQQFTLMAVHRQFNTFAVSGRLIDKRGGTATGYELRNGFGSPGNTRSAIGDGTDTPSAAISGVITAGNLNTAIGVRGPTDLTLYNNGVAGTPANATAVNDMSNSLALHVGTTSPSTGSPLDGEIVAVALWRRALTADEIAAINTYYGTGA